MSFQRLRHLSFRSLKAGIAPGPGNRRPRQATVRTLLAGAGLAVVLAGCNLSEASRQDFNARAKATAMENIARGLPNAPVYCYGGIRGEAMHQNADGTVNAPQVLVESTDLQLAGSCDAILRYPASFGCIDTPNGQSCRIDGYVGPPASVTDQAVDYSPIPPVATDRAS